MRQSAAEKRDLIGLVEQSHLPVRRTRAKYQENKGKIARWHQTLKNRILLQTHVFNGDLEAAIAAVIDHSRHHRCHGGETILAERSRIKHQDRRLNHQRQAQNPKSAGCATRLLSEAAKISPGDMADSIGLALSFGAPVADAAAYFDGLFTWASQRLIHHPALCAAVDGWMEGLDEEDFIAALPAFRRVVSELRWTQRRILMQAALSGPRAAPMTAANAPTAPALPRSTGPARSAPN